MPRQPPGIRYIPGNHDAPLRTLHGLRFGSVRIELEAVHIGADCRRYRGSHGVEFDPARIARDWMQHLGEAMHRLICWGNRRVHAVRQRLELPYLPLSIIVKSRNRMALMPLAQCRCDLTEFARSLSQLRINQPAIRAEMRRGISRVECAISALNAPVDATGRACIPVAESISKPASSASVSTAARSGTKCHYTCIAIIGETHACHSTA